MRRRDFLCSAAAALAMPLGFTAQPQPQRPEGKAKEERGLHLGLVTYNLAKDWDIDTLIRNCSEAGFEGVELRTTHAHGVESTLTKAQREEVRKKFQDSPVRLVGLGTIFEFHSPDPQEVRRNIEGTKEYVVLAHDVGALEVKVRPNGLPPEVPEEKTLEQIGRSLKECGEFARDYGIKVCLEVHGKDTNRLPRIRKILDYADCENVWITWNSNPEDLLDGGLEANFRLVKGRIAVVHMRDLYDEEYPYRRLFELLKESGFTGYCLAEIAGSSDPLRIMRYYRGLFLSLQGLL
ncbi:MAG: sugar phosphate isomerase/epimerase [candidate division KSB1 bacterium]|nr:sugar phosphate isomerase/epimerase [candidate division KSB1 bacterium]